MRHQNRPAARFLPARGSAQLAPRLSRPTTGIRLCGLNRRPPRLAEDPPCLVEHHSTDWKHHAWIVPTRYRGASLASTHLHHSMSTLVISASHSTKVPRG